MNPNKPYIIPDEQIKAQINALDGEIPRDVQWKPGQSWTTLSQKLPKANPNRHTLWLYRGSVAAAVLCLILCVWILEEHKDSQKIPNNLSKKNENIPEKFSQGNTQNIQKPTIKTFQTYTHDTLQITNKVFRKNKPTVFTKKSKQDTLVSVTQEEEQNLVLAESPLQEKEFQEKQKEAKIYVNQQVTLSIAPEALLKSDKKRMNPDQPKDAHLGLKRKHKIQIKIQLDNSTEPNQPTTYSDPFEKLSTKIKLKDKKQ